MGQVDVITHFVFYIFFDFFLKVPETILHWQSPKLWINGFSLCVDSEREEDPPCMYPSVGELENKLSVSA